MYLISIQRSHHIDLDRARKLSENMARDLQKRYGLRWHWEGNQLKFFKPSARGYLRVEEHRVKLELRLGLTLMALAPVMEHTIRQQLDEVIAAG